MAQKTYPPRIMYIECKGEGLHGPARIGKVTFSRTGATLYTTANRSVVSVEQASKRITPVVRPASSIGYRDRAGMERTDFTKATGRLRSMKIFVKSTGPRFAKGLN